MGFELARVARAGVDMPDGQRASERLQDVQLQPGRCYLVGCGRRRGLGADPDAGDLSQHVEHVGS